MIRTLLHYTSSVGTSRTDYDATCCVSAWTPVYAGVFGLPMLICMHVQPSAVNIIDSMARHTVLSIDWSLGTH